MKIKEHKFPTLKAATVKQQEMNKMFGYKPAVLKVTSPQGKKWFSVVQPSGLVRIDKKKK